MADGPRTRIYKPKGPSRGQLKLDNTCRSYRSVPFNLFFSSEPSDDFADHNVRVISDVSIKMGPTLTGAGMWHFMAKRNMSTSHALGSRPPVRFRPTAPSLLNLFPVLFITSPLLQVFAIVAPHRTPLCVHLCECRSLHARKLPIPSCRAL